MERTRQTRRALLGIGLDNDDGHRRITQAEQFAIIGGSEATHEKITETLIRTMEDLSRKGQSLETVETAELVDLLQQNTPE